MRDIEFRVEVNQVSFRPCLQLFVGGRKFPIEISEELAHDFGAIAGLDAAEEIYQIFECEMNAAMSDIEFGLTLEEVRTIKKRIKEKLR